MTGDYDYDKAKAAPETFPEHPPDDCEDMDVQMVEESRMRLQADAAKRAGSILASLDVVEVNALYGALAPLTKKIGWYISRYNIMQSKIWYLADENKKLLKRITKMRSVLEEHGIRGNY